MFAGPNFSTTGQSSTNNKTISFSARSQQQADSSTQISEKNKKKWQPTSKEKKHHHLQENQCYLACFAKKPTERGLIGQWAGELKGRFQETFGLKQSK
jgi:hypothetical protein